MFIEEFTLITLVFILLSGYGLQVIVQSMDFRLTLSSFSTPFTLFSTLRAEIASCLPRGLLSKQRLVIGPIS